MKKISLTLSVIIFTITHIYAQSHFGVHLGSSNYNSAISHIRELGEQIYIRNEFFIDAIGWKPVKNTLESINLCNSFCDTNRSTCDCNPGDFYYRETDSRNSLLETPILIDFYNNNFNQFVNFYSSRYDDVPPKEIVADYPHGHEDIYRDYVSFLVQNFGDKVKYWEVGNENDANCFWAGTPEEYADMLVIASEEIRQNCQDCKVGISFSHPAVDRKSIEEREAWFTYIGNVCDSFDFIDTHFYDPSFITEGQLDRWKETCPGKEFISTETGIPDIDVSTPQNPQNAGGTIGKQAQDLIKYNTLLFAEGYNQLYWYLIDTDCGMGEIFEHNALLTKTYNRKPAFDSYKTMIEKVDYFISISKLAEGQYKYTFSIKNPVYILWCDSGTCSLPQEILDLGTVIVTDYQGNKQTKQAFEIILTEIPVFIEDSISTSIEDNSGNLDDLNNSYLLQNYPNPFNPATKIEYNLPKSNHVTLIIFNLAGQEIETLVNEYQTQGKHQVKWEEKGLPNGIYIYRLQVGGFAETKKLILQK